MIIFLLQDTLMVVMGVTNTYWRRIISDWT